MKTLIMIGLVAFCGTLHAATYQCFVIGQNSQNPNDYTELLRHVPSVVLQGPGATQVIYQAPEYSVYLALNDQGKLGISVIESPVYKVSAAASAGQDELTLIDASKKVSVICKK